MLVAHALGLIFGALAIFCHYEVLRALSSTPLLNVLRTRPRTLLTVFIIFLAHGLEIWLFSASLYLSHEVLNLGELQGQFNGGLRDYTYFSAVAYTSLGFGDIYPTGYLRTIVAYETVTGLLMMAWSAAYTLHFMQRHWEDKN